MSKGKFLKKHYLRINDALNNRPIKIDDSIRFYDDQLLACTFSLGVHRQDIIDYYITNNIKPVVWEYVKEKYNIFI